ncbi:hypothetical protein EAY56_24070, partial [Vibrio anguillarum]|nr:hypothetical protein [Vibrio anguillarum]
MARIRKRQESDQNSEMHWRVAFMNYINSENKNGLWELEIKGIEGPILASDYLGLYGSTPDEARTASIKKKIVVHSAEGE